VSAGYLTKLTHQTSLPDYTEFPFCALQAESFGTIINHIASKKKTRWPESESELYRSSYRCLSAKLVPNFADKGVSRVSVTDPYGRILGFLDRSRYFSRGRYFSIK
jgi:hypothetical protein